MADLFADAVGHEQHWRVPGIAQGRLDGQLAPKQPARLPAKTLCMQQPSRRSTAPARCSRREADQARSRDNSQERAERRAAERAAKKAAQVEALEREWRVQQVAGELGRQADLLERHRHLVAKHGASDALDQPHQLAGSPRQVKLLQLLLACILYQFSPSGNVCPCSKYKSWFSQLCMPWWQKLWCTILVQGLLYLHFQQIGEECMATSAMYACWPF